MRALYVLLTLGFAATPAFANVIPEPSSIALVGLGLAVAIAVAVRKKK